MLFEEALKAMREGKKVKVNTGNPNIDRWRLWLKRNKEDEDVIFLGLNEDVWECPYVLSTQSILTDNWEVCDE